jgi:pimeloyl-ACP methyl ester carboxylesterase
VRIHYVDWGGSGPVIILLTGLGDSARIFDDLGPRLAQSHRVIALTRRGYGLSDHGQKDYSNAALVDDVLGVMDALAIRKASLVGHSIAGGELSTLGEHHGDRVDRLVYLDSAYDRTRALELTNKVPATPGPSAADRASLDAMARWREALLGVHTRAVRENVSDTMRLDHGQAVPRTPPKVMLEVLAGDVAAKPDYAAISAPALAIYSSKDVAEQISPQTPPAAREAVVDYASHVIRPWMLRAQADFLEHKRCGVAVELPHSTHYFFLTRPAWTAKAILDFLAARDPCHWSPATVPQTS